MAHFPDLRILSPEQIVVADPAGLQKGYRSYEERSALHYGCVYILVAVCKATDFQAPGLSQKRGSEAVPKAG